MSEEPVEDHLSKISTCWSQVFRAHNGGGHDLSSARQKLLQRYCGAIYRYAKAALRDSAAADEVLQDFAYCFLRGDFQGANPGKGRFRDLVKTVLFHLIVNHQRQRRHERTQPLSSKLKAVELLQDSPSEEADVEFLRLWREELLNRAWSALGEHERAGGHYWYSVLKLHAEDPNISSEKLANCLTVQFKRPISAAGIRQTLHRAREKFANLLIDEIGRSLETAHREAIEQELIDLDLLIYCKSALGKRYARD